MNGLEKLVYKTVTSKTKPDDIDMTSSKAGVYVRKDFEQVRQKIGNKLVDLWQYEEMFIPKKIWEAFAANKKVLENTEAIVAAEQIITDMDLRQIETEITLTDMDIKAFESEMALTDMDIRLLTLEATVGVDGEEV